MNCEDRFRTMTVREKEVLSLVAEGDTNSEIAARLEISSRTVETRDALARAARLQVLRHRPGPRPDR